MGLLSSAMKTELRKQAPEIAWLFSFTVAGVAYRFSDAGRSSAAGLYEPKVLSWGGSMRRGVSPHDPVLELSSVEILLDDTGQTLTTLLQGPLRNQVRGAAATVQLASPNVAAANWFSQYAGLINTIGQPSPLIWSFQLSPNALPLRRESVPKARINVSDWPASEVSVRNLPMPILYGQISSSNGANNGAIPTYLVDSGGFRYLVCAGRALAIDTVYKDGVAVAASNYAITYPTVNGRIVTLIDFTASQGASAITCDARGYDTVGDGSGTLITDPAAILKHLLVNWIYGDYKAGAWLSDSTAPVDTTSFATTFFSDRGYQASLYIASTKRKGLDIVNDFLKSFEARACWTPAGKIALKIEDFTAWSYVADDMVLHEDEAADWKLDYPVAQLVDAVEAQWAQTPIGGYTQTLAVKDLGTDEDAPDEIQLPYSPAFFL